MTTGLIALLMWGAAADRTRRLYKERTSVNLGYCIAAVGVAGAFSMKLIEQPTDQLFGPYVSDLIKHLLTIIGGGGAQILLLALRSNEPGPSRWQIAHKMRVALAVCVVICVTFMAAPIHGTADNGDLDVVFDHVAAVGLYRLAFNLYIAYVLISNYRLCRRYVSTEDDRGVRLSVRLVGAGSLLALGYSLSRFTFVVYVFVGRSSPAALDTLGSAAAALGLLCMGLGILAPGVAYWKSDHDIELDKIRRLTPLWTDLTHACPSVILRTSPPWTLGRALLRCNRYLTEIGESLLMVRLSDLAAQQVESAGDPLRSLAVGLYEGRECWLTASGPLAGHLLPVASDTAQYEQTILDMADAYRSCALPLQRSLDGVGYGRDS